MAEQKLRAAIQADPENPEPYLVYADWLQANGRLQGELVSIMLAREQSRDTDEMVERLKEIQDDPGLWPMAVGKSARQIGTRFHWGVLKEIWCPPVMTDDAVAAALSAHEWSLELVALSPRHLPVMADRKIETLVLDLCHRNETLMVDPKALGAFRVGKIYVQGVNSFTDALGEQLIGLVPFSRERIRAGALHFDLDNAEFDVFDSLEIDYASPERTLRGPVLPWTYDDANEAKAFFQNLAETIALPPHEQEVWAEEFMTNWMEGRSPARAIMPSVLRVRRGLLRAQGARFPPLGELEGGALLVYLRDEWTGDMPPPLYWVATVRELLICWIPGELVEQADATLNAFSANPWGAWVRPGDPELAKRLPPWLIAVGAEPWEEKE